MIRALGRPRDQKREDLSIPRDSKSEQTPIGIPWRPRARIRLRSPTEMRRRQLDVDASANGSSPAALVGLGIPKKDH